MEIKELIKFLKISECIPEALVLLLNGSVTVSANTHLLSNPSIWNKKKHIIKYMDSAQMQYQVVTQSTYKVMNTLTRIPN